MCSFHWNIAWIVKFKDHAKPPAEEHADGYSSNINRNELRNFRTLEIAWTSLEVNQIVAFILQLNRKTLRYHRLPYFSPNGAILRNIFLGGSLRLPPSHTHTDAATGQQIHLFRKFPRKIKRQDESTFSNAFNES